MKKFNLLAIIALAIAFVLAGCADNQAPTLAFKEAQLIGTIKEVVKASEEYPVNYWTVMLDGKTAPYHLLTDEKKGTAGDRVVITMVVRTPNGPSWTSIRFLDQ